MLPRLVRNMSKAAADGYLGLGKFPIPVPTTPLAVAAANGELALIAAADLGMLNAQDDTKNTPLIWAADAGKLSVVEAMVARGVDVNTAGFIGNTALARAARQGHTEVARALLTAPNCTCHDTCNSKSQSIRSTLLPTSAMSRRSK